MTVKSDGELARWAHERWNNRAWNPSAELMAEIPYIRQTSYGQALMRLLDASAIAALEDIAGATNADPLQVARAQGEFQAFRRVMDWLLAERADDEQQASEGEPELTVIGGSSFVEQTTQTEEA